MIAKIILNITNKLKPILLKVLPYKLLRNLKGKMISNSFKKLNKIDISSYKPEKYPFGINLIGNIKAETGLGQSCRLLANQLEHADIPFMIYHYDQLGNIRTDDNSWDYKISNKLMYGINMIHINPHEMGLAFMQLSQECWNDRYNIAFWLWELEEFPEEWIPCFHVIDEVWTPSEFISTCIRKKTSLPVKTIPYHVVVDIKKEYSREYFQLPKDAFLYLMMYDSGSIMERKNPLGVLETFKKVFQKNDKKVGLVIKIGNYGAEDIEAISRILDGYTNVYFIKEVLDKDQVNSLIKQVDVFVSLHRAEGFGLVLAESMLLGTPTIATNWSSNIEFMNSDVACMVDANMISIEKDIGPFKKGNKWADPDLNQAAFYMKKLYEDRDFYQDIARRAKSYVKEKLSMEHSTQLIKKNIEEIEKNIEKTEII